MKTAAEVSITKRVLEEPQAADGITRRSPEPLAADGAGIAKKRARTSEKPSKEEKGAEEKIKRSKKKSGAEEEGAEEKIKRSKKDKGAKDKGAEGKSKISKKKRSPSKKEEEAKEKGAEEKSKRSKKRPEEKNKQLAEFEKMAEERSKRSNQEKTDKESGAVMKKKKVVKWRLSQELLDYLRTKEVMGLIATEAPLALWVSKMTGSLFDQTLKEDIAAEFQENKEFDAYVLYQYRTDGYAEIEEVVSDEEDVEEDEG